MAENVPPMPDMKELEKLAKEHEDFGFGNIDAHGLTTHGFNPEGLEKFIRELIKIRDKQWGDFLHEKGVASLTWCP